MAGAMRKMAVYLGLVEDDGYDGRGFDPDDDFEPELDPELERDRRRHEPPHQSHQPQRDESVRVVQSSAQREAASRSAPLSAEPARPARIAPVASITQERQSLEKNAPVIMPKVVSERE